MSHGNLYFTVKRQFNKTCLNWTKAYVSRERKPENEASAFLVSFIVMTTAEKEKEEEEKKKTLNHNPVACEELKRQIKAEHFSHVQVGTTFIL